jgi:subtilisin family serine protease
VKVVGGPSTAGGAGLLAWLARVVAERFDVVNLSGGTTKRSFALPLYELCDRAYFAGSLIVAAASNVVRDSYPSLFSSVASVACTFTSDPTRFHFNPDPPTEFLARGIDVEVPWKDGARVRATGNSYAASHLSGLAALLKSKYPYLRPFELKAALWANAANIRDAPELLAGRVTRTTAAIRAAG